LCACLSASAPFAAAAGKTETNSIGMEFVFIPAGAFDRKLEKPVQDEAGETLYDNQKVIVSRPFYLGKYEVTQEQWAAVMGSHPATDFKAAANPAIDVSWNDVQEFIRRLNAKEGTNRYRLPSEAEWELAARGGTESWFFFMKDPENWQEAIFRMESLLDEYAWFDKNSGGINFARKEWSSSTGEPGADGKPHPVGQKKPNPYGLHDIYGNVWEWVQDWYLDAEALPADRELVDYRGPAQGDARATRGGSWQHEIAYCTSHSRGYAAPDSRNVSQGFRLAFSPE
jgi:formylglycine-generating enzyme required for sulfatase activity